MNVKIPFTGFWKGAALEELIPTTLTAFPYFQCFMVAAKIVSKF
jgi:hypothetical protein